MSSFVNLPGGGRILSYVIIRVFLHVIHRVNQLVSFAFMFYPMQISFYLFLFPDATAAEEALEAAVAVGEEEKEEKDEEEEEQEDEEKEGGDCTDVSSSSDGIL